MRFARSCPKFTTRWLHLKSCSRCCCTERPAAAVCRPDTKVNSAERTAGSNKHQPLVRLIAVVYARPLQPMRPGRRRLRDDAPGKYAWLAVRVRIRTRVRAIGCRVCSIGGLENVPGILQNSIRTRHWCARAAQPPLGVARVSVTVCYNMYALPEHTPRGEACEKKNKKTGFKLGLNIIQTTTRNHVHETLEVARDLKTYFPIESRISLSKEFRRGGRL